MRRPEPDGLTCDDHSARSYLDLAENRERPTQRICGIFVTEAARSRPVSGLLLVTASSHQMTTTVDYGVRICGRGARI